MFKIEWNGIAGVVGYDTEDSAERAIGEILDETFGLDGDADAWIIARDEYKVISI